MKKIAYLGIDTSCYTTSVALIDDKGALVGEARKVLHVKEGKCGLKQSEMVFQHTRNLPVLVKTLFENYAGEIRAVGVSGRPRPLANSYMPAFLVGLGFAESLAAILKTKLYIISHQENHLEAGIWSAKGPVASKFLMLHASGGTTDLLSAEPKPDGSYQLDHIGGSIDLHAGQFVDRIGVGLDLPFPAGPHLEAIAESASEKIALPIAVNGLNVSFSGPATAAQRLLDANVDKPAIALGVQYALAETFARVLRNAARACMVNDVLFVGGVSANKYITTYLKKSLEKQKIKLWIPESRFSSDNAAGCAAYALRMETINAKESLYSS